MNPPLQTNIQAQGFPQESLSRLHGSSLLHLELEQTEDSGADDEEFHLGDIAADARARTSAEGDESGLLARGETSGIPTIGDELVGVRAPDFLRVVDCVGRDGDDVAGLEFVAGNVDGLRCGRYLAGKTHGRCAVNTHGFPDDPLQAVR